MPTSTSLSVVDRVVTLCCSFLVSVDLTVLFLMIMMITIVEITCDDTIQFGRMWREKNWKEERKKRRHGRISLLLCRESFRLRDSDKLDVIKKRFSLFEISSPCHISK